MVRHIVSWNFKEGLSEAQKREHAAQIKSELEGLAGVIGGLLEMKVYYGLLPASNREILLDSSFDSADSLAGYQVHPEHKKAAAFIVSVTEDKVCLDYEF